MVKYEGRTGNDGCIVELVSNVKYLGHEEFYRLGEYIHEKLRI
jgi:hypothetical protein